MNREAIYLALFAMIQNITGIQNTAREFIKWSDLQPEQLPFLLLVEGKEVADVNGRGIPARWTFKPELLCYVADQEGKAPGELINPLLDAIQNAFSPAILPVTLGGLVDRVLIKGTVDKGQDKLGQLNWFMVPFEIVVPA